PSHRCRQGRKARPSFLRPAALRSPPGYNGSSTMLTKTCVALSLLALTSPAFAQFQGIDDIQGFSRRATPPQYRQNNTFRTTTPARPTDHPHASPTRANPQAPTYNSTNSNTYSNSYGSTYGGPTTMGR